MRKLLKMETNKTHPKADLLWKAIIEDFIVEVIAYFYPEIEKERAIDQPIEFLDKFLQTLHPEAVEGNRRADLLVKVPLKNGKEKWILLHIEVQGYQDKHLARRMFTYFHRSLDRFGVPVEALVIFTDSNTKYRPNYYEFKGIKTNCSYTYNTFKIADYKMEDFERMNSPLGFIFQTALLGLQKNLKDEELLQMKTTLYRKLLEKGYSKEVVGFIGIFLRDLVHFKKTEFNLIFVEEVNKIEKNNRAMGIVETVIKYNREEAEVIGKEIGKEIGKFLNNLKNKIDFLKKFKDRQFTDLDLSEMISEEVNFVKDFKKAYTEDKFNELCQNIQQSEKLDNLDTFKRQLVKDMYHFGFSKRVLAKYFNKKERVIAKIVESKK